MSEEFEEKKGFSAVARYTIVALILGFVTAIEVAVLYPPIAETGDTFKIFLLVALSIGKFILVVALFMHLWHDPFLYTGIFATGMILACGTLVALMAVMNVYPVPEDAVKPRSPEELRKHQAEGEHHSFAPTEFQHRLATFAATPERMVVS